MAYHLVISDGFGQSEIEENYAHPAAIAFSTFHKKPGKAQCKKILINSDQCKKTLTNSDSHGTVTVNLFRVSNEVEIESLKMLNRRQQGAVLFA